MQTRSSMICAFRKLTSSNLLLETKYITPVYHSKGVKANVVSQNGIYRFWVSSLVFGLNICKSYILQADKDKYVLNMRRIWTGPVRTASAVARDLQTQALRLSDNFITKGQASKDYQDLKTYFSRW